MERLLVEALQQQLQPFLEDFAVGVGIEQRRAKGLDLAGVIAAADPHDHPAVGHDVGHRVVLGEPDGVPHRQDVERASQFKPLGLGRQPKAELDQVRQALVAFALEMMLGRPQRVIALLVHDPRHVAHRREDLGQALVRIPAIVRRGPVEPDIVELDLADIERVKPLDHGAVLPPSGDPGEKYITSPWSRRKRRLAVANSAECR